MHACFCSRSPSLNDSHLSLVNFKFVTLTVTLTAMSEQGDETLKVHHAQRKDRKKAVPTGTAQSQVATELGVVTAQTRALEEKNKTKYIHIHKQLTHTHKQNKIKNRHFKKKKKLHKVYPHLFFQGWGGSRELGGREGNRSLKLLFVCRYFAMKMLNGVAQNCLGDWHPLGVQTTILSLVGWHFARKQYNGAAQNCPDNWHPLGVQTLTFRHACSRNGTVMLMFLTS